MILEPSLDLAQDFPMADEVLRHRRWPAMNAVKERFGREAEDRLEFLLDEREQRIIAEIQDFSVTSATEETAQQGVAGGRTMIEFVVHKRARKKPPILLLGHEVSKTRRQPACHLRIAAERDGHGRSVLNGAKHLRELRIKRAQQPRALERGQR